MYKILLVEDEDIIRRGIRHSVPWEELGTTVVAEAANGRDGMAKIAEFRPDIVITDINMPIMDGLKMIENTRTEFDYVSIILTGYSDFEYAREAIRNGVSDYVLKPLNVDEMKEALQRAILECENIRQLRSRNKAGASLQTISLLREPAKEAGEVDPIVAQVLSIIRDEYANKLTMSDFEERLHYSERYISIRFQKAMETTVIEYLNRYRIQQAISLLRDNTLQISDVAAACGVGEYKYFNQVFKKYIGCSPKEFRNHLK